MTTTEELIAEAFERGRMSARLDGHDEHLDKLNEVIDELKQNVVQIAMSVQRLSDDAIARDATTVATAKALREADEARRAKSEQAWTPMARFYLALSIVAAIVVTSAALYGIFRN